MCLRNLNLPSLKCLETSLARGVCLTVQFNTTITSLFISCVIQMDTA